MSSSNMHQMNPQEVQKLRSLPGNDRCIDCGSSDTDWASVSLGIFFCLDCSGRHRGLGTHISFVRSVTMDSWTDAQIERMKKGGNQQCKDFLTKYGVDLKSSIRTKYDTPAAQLYQDVIKARVSGTPEPTELPKPRAKGPAVNRPMVGFGSTPLPKKRKKRLSGKIAVAAVSVGAIIAWSFLKKH